MSKRDLLIDTAVRLFSANGFHATGVDTISKEAGVTKRTLYHHFQTKEELILAALRHYDGISRNHFMRSVRSSADDPKYQLLAAFDVTRDWFRQKDFYGCIFINAVGEHSQPNSMLREICKNYKKMMLDFFTTLSTEAGAAEPKKLGKALALLLEGATVTAQIGNSPESAETAKEIAQILIDKHLG